MSETAVVGPNVSVGSRVVGLCVSPIRVGNPVVGRIVSAVGILLVGICVSLDFVGIPDVGKIVVGS